MACSNSLPIRRLLACSLTLSVGGAAAVLMLLAMSGWARRGEASGPLVVYPGCAPTIQLCLDGALPGQTVLIQAGNYVTSLTLSKAVSLTGVGSAQVTLHALANQRVLTVTGSIIKNTVIISGLTLAGGHVLGAACPLACGGGIAVLSNATPVVDNVLVTNNQAEHFGGGIYADTDSQIQLKDVRVISNSAAVNGGGAYLYSVAQITRGEFRDNHSQDYGAGLVTSYILTLTGTQFYSNLALGDGGGLYALGDAWLTDATFQNNSGQNGGGAYFQAPLQLTAGSFQGNQASAGGGLFAGNTLALVGTQFLSNTAATAGGGAYASATATLGGANFQKNTCTSPGCRGGGLFAASGFTIAAVEFRDNSAAQGGGLWQLAGSGLVANALFAGNSAVDSGAALDLHSSGRVQIVDTTIASPTLGAQAAINVVAGTVAITATIVASYSVGINQTGGSVSEDYNLFTGNGVNFAGSVAIGAHQVNSDPNFANLNAGNYHLSVGSAAIDGGANAGQRFDFEGDPRPIGAGFDIGYDEFGLVLHLPVVRH